MQFNPDDDKPTIRERAANLIEDETYVLHEHRNVYRLEADWYSIGLVIVIVVFLIKQMG